MINNDSFEKTGKELDQIIREGYFGEETLSLLSKRDDISLSEYYYLIIKGFIDNSEEVELQEVGKYLENFFYLYVDGIKVNEEEVVSILTSFFKGREDNNEFEFHTSYIEYAMASQKYKQVFNSLKVNRVLKTHEKKELCNSLVNAYSKGIEYINKILIACMSIAYVAKQEKYDQYSINSLTLYKKIKLFSEMTNGKYQTITDGINRKIRNAESHLNIVYDTHKNTYIMKEQREKIIETEISFYEMSIEHNKITRLIVAFGFSIQLYYLVNTDYNKYKEITSLIFK